MSGSEKMEEFAPGVEHLIGLVLRREGVFPRETTATLVRVTGRDPRLIERARAAIRSDDPTTRAGGFDILREVGVPASVAIPDLLAACESADADTRMYAAEALGEVGKRDPEVAGILLKMTHDRVWHVRGIALEALASVETRNAEALDRALALLDDTEGHDWSCRDCAVRVLGRLGAVSRPAVTTLCELLTDEDGLFNGEVCDALGSIGSGARDALVPLEQLYADETYHEYYGEQIASAISRIQNESLPKPVQEHPPA